MRAADQSAAALRRDRRDVDDQTITPERRLANTFSMLRQRWNALFRLTSSMTSRSQPLISSSGWDFTIRYAVHRTVPHRWHGAAE